MFCLCLTGCSSFLPLKYFLTQLFSIVVKLLGVIMFLRKHKSFKTKSAKWKNFKIKVVKQKLKNKKGQNKKAALRREQLIVSFLIMRG